MFNRQDRVLLEAVAELAYQNPFLPGRIDLEKKALGSESVDVDSVWSRRADFDVSTPNHTLILKRLETLIENSRSRLHQASTQEVSLFGDAALYLLYNRYSSPMADLIRDTSRMTQSVTFYDAFVQDLDGFFSADPRLVADRPAPDHLFASFFQIRRAFHMIFSYIVGVSMPAARLRAMVWQSVFTHDMRRYRRSLFGQMGDFTTLITGPSGTGKELVARAIGLSRFVPFDAVKKTFRADYRDVFFALNLTALSPTLIESELFGHRRGSFTGAVEDRTGWLEQCPALGTVFLDEIGEVEKSIQVKLLRVLQHRTFQRLGETQERHFPGKIICATNRDLFREMEAGQFRHDLYYRLCADIVQTPSLREQLDDREDELANLVTFISRRVAGDEESEVLSREVVTWVTEQLGTGYPWPGNVRELEQCVRNVLIRNEYNPPRRRTQSGVRTLVDRITNGELSAEELMTHYCTLVYSQTGSYVETARKIGLDRRTVKSRVDHGLSEALEGTSP